MSEQDPGGGRRLGGDDPVEPVLGDPVPRSVIEQAKSLRYPRETGALAVLVFDSLVDGGDRPEDHHMLFQHGELHLDVHICAGQSGSQITGILSAPGWDRAVLSRQAVEEVSVSPLRDNRFAFEPVPHGVIRLAVEAPGGRQPTIWTDWFRI